jgi:hypothetical protein
VGTRVGRAGQPEERHAGLVRQVAQQSLGLRQGRDGRPAEIRRARLQQPPAAVLDHEHLLLGPVEPSGGALRGLDHQREQGGGDPGDGGDRQPEAGRGEARHRELDQAAERGQGVPEDRNRAPGLMRNQCGRDGGDEREHRGQAVEPEIQPQAAAGPIGRDGGAPEPAEQADPHGGQCGRHGQRVMHWPEEVR